MKMSGKMKKNNKVAADTEFVEGQSKNTDGDSLSSSVRQKKKPKFCTKQGFKHWYKNMDFFISESGSFKENWDFLIMIFACWNVFMLPISIAFNTESDILDWINYVVDVSFIIDILVNFRTTILDEDSGEVIKDSLIIAKEYMKGRLTVDILSSLPFDYIAYVSTFKN